VPPATGDQKGWRAYGARWIWLRRNPALARRVNFFRASGADIVECPYSPERNGRFGAYLIGFLLHFQPDKVPHEALAGIRAKVLVVSGGAAQ
jgi:hypothetical protein